MNGEPGKSQAIGQRPKTISMLKKQKSRSRNKLPEIFHGITPQCNLWLHYVALGPPKQKKQTIKSGTKTCKEATIHLPGSLTASMFQLLLISHNSLQNAPVQHHQNQHSLVPFQIFFTFNTGLLKHVQIFSASFHGNPALPPVLTQFQQVLQKACSN